jgi:hypothetical protein
MNTQVKTWVGTVVIIIMAITAIVFVWIYKKNLPEIAPSQIKISKNNQPAEQPQSANHSTPEVKSSQITVKIKDMGFKMTIDSSVLGDLIYKIIPGGDGYSSVAFSSKTLNALSVGCADGTAVISKINGTPQKNATGESQFYLGRMADIKQFDGFFLFYAGPQDSCSAGKHTDLESKVVQIVSDGFKNISLIEKDNITSDWQTYRNEKYGFEFQYSNKDCILTQDQQDNGLFIELYKNGKCPDMEKRGDLGTLTFSYQYDTLNIIPFIGSLENYIKNESGPIIKQRKNMKINGNIWTMLYFNCDNEGGPPSCYTYDRELVFKNNEKEAIYSILATGESDNAAKEIAEDITRLDE